MNMDTRVRELLFTHNCVIIPGLGGFVAEYRPARVHPGNNEFSPPGKAIAFNPRLDRNDGVLANELAALESISFAEAELKVRQFAEQCSKTLKSDRSLRFDGVGKLVLEDQDIIRFIPEESTNFLEDSFGLRTFKAAPIIRDKQAAIEEKIKEVSEVRLKPNALPDNVQPAGEKWSSSKWWIAAAAFLVLFGAFMVASNKKGLTQAGLWPEGTSAPIIAEARMFSSDPLIPSVQDRMESYGKVTPLSERAPTATLEGTLAEASIGTTTETAIESTESIETPVTTENPAAEVLSSELEKIDPPVEIEIASANNTSDNSINNNSNILYKSFGENKPLRGYYIVIGSFSSEGIANNRLLDNQGSLYNGASILRNSGKFRAAIFVSPNEMEVWNQLSKLRAEYSQSDAWILKY
ncbi:MAG: hypothetical protein ACI959_001363 [Limisphaerales bacterium]|jgi:hypothetical protein